MDSKDIYHNVVRWRLSQNAGTTFRGQLRFELTFMHCNHVPRSSNELPVEEREGGCLGQGKKSWKHDVPIEILLPI